MPTISSVRRVSAWLGCALLLCSLNVAGQSRGGKKIRSMLAAQVKEWNRGNLEGYMHGYWENDSLLFIGSKGPRYGYKTTLQKYREAYPDTAHMGRLTSTITRVEKLSRKYYFVVGTWALERSIGNVSGSFTLLVKKAGGGWVIVADHSS